MPPWLLENSVVDAIQPLASAACLALLSLAKQSFFTQYKKTDLASDAAVNWTGLTGVVGWLDIRLLL